MFETSIVRAQAVGSRRRYYSLLSVSLVAHTAAIVGAVAISVASVDFPADAPDQFALLRPVAAMSVPPPLGTPEGDNRPKAATPQQPKAATPPAPQQQTAPSVVPPTTPELPVASTSTEGTGNVDPNAGTGTGPKGVPGGDPNSVAKDDVQLPTTPIVEDKIYEVRGDVKAPRVIQRVEPNYPRVMIMAKKSATVTVRCIIDRNGGVRDVEVVRSTFPAADTAVLEAMQQWRFAPGSLNGRAVDTVFELTVHFSVK